MQFLAKYSYFCKKIQWFMDKKTVLTTLLFLCFSVVMTGADKKFTLVIDAGHGGTDIGAPGKRTNEKTINLKVALAFGGYVERNCNDVNVIYTRKTDKFVPLYARAQVANKNKADLFISIHTNALPKGRIARGLETYTLGMHRADDNLDVAKRENDVILLESDHKERYEGFDPNSAESYIIFEFMQDKNMEYSVEMARLIQNRTCATAGRNNMGVKQAGFLVLRETSMPSCLVELGFISTSDEEDFLRSAQGVDKLALGLYRAFTDYRKKYFGATTNAGAAQQDAIPVQQNAAAAEQAVIETAQSQTQANGEPSNEAFTASVSNQTKIASEAKTIFKVQILTSTKRLNAGNQQFKGRKDVDSYRENNIYKYTVGASEDYNEINSLRRSLSKTFPQAFVVAFKNGKRMDIQKAINEFNAGSGRKK